MLNRGNLPFCSPANGFSAQEGAGSRRQVTRTPAWTVPVEYKAHPSWNKTNGVEDASSEGIMRPCGGTPLEGGLLGMWVSGCRWAHVCLLSCSTSGPPLWPGSTFFKRNGALLQGKSLEAPLHLTPSRDCSVLGVDQKVLPCGEVWLLWVGSVCPVVSISSYAHLLVALNCSPEARPAPSVCRYWSYSRSVWLALAK